MTSDIPVDPIQATILAALKHSPKTQGELYDLTACGSYPILNSYLKPLIDSKQIQPFFTEATDERPQCLASRLCAAEPARPFFLAMFRPN